MLIKETGLVVHTAVGFFFLSLHDPRSLPKACAAQSTRRPWSRKAREGPRLTGCLLLF